MANTTRQGAVSPWHGDNWQTIQGHRFCRERYRVVQ